MTAYWAYSANVPGKTCEDARLLGGGTNIQYPAGNDKGQAGWDVGLQFNNLGDLAEKLRSLYENKGRISRLAINVHGAPGTIDADSNGKSYDFDALWNKYSSQLVFINNLLDAGAIVLIMGCNVASGDAGAAFLTQLSSQVFKGHKVVGFTTVGETLRQFRQGEQCSEPGMRDTPYDNPSNPMPVGTPGLDLEREKEVLSLPWASETSPHAKIALNGAIIFGAEPSVPKTDYSADAYLPGTWSVESGAWKGYYIFAKQPDCYWMDNAGTIRHHGQWYLPPGTGSVAWRFDEEAPDWNSRPEYEVLLPLKTIVDGNKTLKGAPYGSFKMVKQ